MCCGGYRGYRQHWSVKLLCLDFNILDYMCKCGDACVIDNDMEDIFPNMCANINIIHRILKTEAFSIFKILLISIQVKEIYQRVRAPSCLNFLWWEPEWGTLEYSLALLLQVALVINMYLLKLCTFKLHNHAVIQWWPTCNFHNLALKMSEPLLMKAWQFKLVRQRTH